MFFKVIYEKFHLQLQIRNWTGNKFKALHMPKVYATTYLVDIF